MFLFTVIKIILMIGCAKKNYCKTKKQITSKLFIWIKTIFFSTISILLSECWLTTFLISDSFKLVLVKILERMNMLSIHFYIESEKNNHVCSKALFDNLSTLHAFLSTQRLLNHCNALYCLRQFVCLILWGGGGLHLFLFFCLSLFRRGAWLYLALFR